MESAAPVAIDVVCAMESDTSAAEETRPWIASGVRVWSAVLKATIAELITATEIAERAIAGLKVTARECNDNMGGQLATAGEITERLNTHIHASETVLHRLSRVVIAARAQPEEAQARSKNAKAIIAAAEAFTERKRANGLAA